MQFNMFSLLYLLMLYPTFVYIIAKVSKMELCAVETMIWSFLRKWWQENISGNTTEVRKTVPVQYAEQIYDSVKPFTANGFDFTLWNNHVYSDYEVPCFSLDIVPTTSDIDTDLPIIEVRALDRFRKCALVDNLLASRIISEKSQGKVFLHILYASNKEELARYNSLLETEKIYADSVGLRNSTAITDSTLSEALNLFEEKTCGACYDRH